MIVISNNTKFSQMRPSRREGSKGQVQSDFTGSLERAGGRSDTKRHRGMKGEFRRSESQGKEILGAVEAGDGLQKWFALVRA